MTDTNNIIEEFRTEEFHAFIIQYFCFYHTSFININLLINHGLLNHSFDPIEISKLISDIYEIIVKYKSFIESQEISDNESSMLINNIIILMSKCDAYFKRGVFYEYIIFNFTHYLKYFNAYKVAWLNHPSNDISISDNNNSIISEINEVIVKYKSFIESQEISDNESSILIVDIKSLMRKCEEHKQ